MVHACECRCPKKPEEELDPLEQELQAIVSWVPNSSPLQEQYVLSTAEPSLQPLPHTLVFNGKKYISCNIC